MKVSPKNKDVPIKQVFAESVINTMGNSAVMIDDRQEIIFVQGDVGPYLTLAQGEIGLNILNMARPITSFCTQDRRRCTPRLPI